MIYFSKQRHDHEKIQFVYFRIKTAYILVQNDISCLKTSVYRKIQEVLCFACTHGLFVISPE